MPGAGGARKKQAASLTVLENLDILCPCPEPWACSQGALCSRLVSECNAAQLDPWTARECSDSSATYGPVPLREVLGV